MKRRRLIWQLYPSYLFITLAAIWGIGWFASHTVERLTLHALTESLRTRAQVIETLLDDEVGFAQRAEVQRLCEEVGTATDTRITVILADGQVLAESDPQAPGESHALRPEVREALGGQVGVSRRYSTSVGTEMLYMAIPAYRGGKLLAVVRTGVPVEFLASELNAVQWKISLAGGVVALLSALVGLLVSRRVTRPVELLRAGAERFAKGDLAHRVPVPANAELAGLAETLNHMAQQLQDRIRTLARQGNEQEAVLASMVEGVLAVDVEQRIISINEAAAALVDSEPLAAIGRSLQEVIRNNDLRKFVSQSLQSEQPIEADIILHGSEERILQAHGTALRDAAGNGIGAVIVLNEVTELRRLENMRSDFVANVSHELRTPITSIKGFIETLLDGALDNREDAERFLRIVVKQADRLSAIIEDLLSLSKIEHTDYEELPLELAAVDEVLAAAVSDCQAQASDRQIRIETACQPGLRATMNPPLLEQALVNLLDNAIKYSDVGQSVRLQAEQLNGSVVLSVRDEGCGIPPDDQSRIFERFYRVDKGRSRKLGGTGLGLSIVKHIVQAHRGSVEVESTFGQGSTFTIRLPVSK